MLWGGYAVGPASRADARLACVGGHADGPRMGDGRPASAVGDEFCGAGPSYLTGASPSEGAGERAYRDRPERLLNSRLSEAAGRFGCAWTWIGRISVTDQLGA